MGVRAWCAALGLLAAAEAMAADSAVVVMYHRIGEDRFPSTSVRIDQFEAHVREFAAGGWNVLPLTEVAEALAAGRPLPERAVAISMDDAYLSIHREAWPRLRAAGLPFTVFVATDDVDRGRPPHMNWDQVRELARAGVTIGAHSAAHPHYPALSDAAIDADLDRAEAVFARELGRRPDLFAYPFGEAGSRVRERIVRRGHTAAFGQHSGVASRWEDRFDLPRFALNESYGEPGRLRAALGALPVPFRDAFPRDTAIGVGAANPPALGFVLDGPVANADRLACFLNGRKATLDRGPEGRIGIRADQPFARGRTRLNCTIPADGGRWRWLGRQFVVP